MWKNNMKVQSKVYKNQYLMCYYKLVYKYKIYQ